MIFEQIGEKYGIKVYPYLKCDDKKVDEYIVYRLGSDRLDCCQHSFESRIKTYDLMYFIRFEHYTNEKYRKAILERCRNIKNDLKKENYLCPSGFYEIGDIDSIGYITLLATFNFSEVIKCI